MFDSGGVCPTILQGGLSGMQFFGGSILLYSQTKSTLNGLIAYLERFHLSLTVVTMLDDALSVLHGAHCDACIIHMDDTTRWTWKQVVEVMNASIGTYYVVINSSGKPSPDISGNNILMLTNTEGSKGIQGFVKRYLTGAFCCTVGGVSADSRTLTQLEYFLPINMIMASTTSTTSTASTASTTPEDTVPAIFHRHTTHIDMNQEGVYSKGYYHTSSFKMKSLFRQVPKLAESETHILIEGEQGVGKTALALAIHAVGANESSRNTGGAVIVNVGKLASCASVSGGRILDYVFGAETSSDKTATTMQNAICQQGFGMVILQGVNLLSSRLQKRVMAFMDKHPAGTPIAIDGDAHHDHATHNAHNAHNAHATVPMPRIVLTPSEDDTPLRKATQPTLSSKRRGSFHNDIYELADMDAMYIPPLRDRPEDIPHFVASFITTHTKNRNTAVQAQTTENATDSGKHLQVLRKILLKGQLWDTLATYYYQGNIDELNRIVRYVVHGYPSVNIQQLIMGIRSKGFGRDDAGINISMDSGLYLLGIRLASSSDTTGGQFALEEYTKIVEKPLFRAVLDYTKGNKTQTAFILGLSRTTLRKKLTDYDLIDDSNP